MRYVSYVSDFSTRLCSSCSWFAKSVFSASSFSTNIFSRCETSSLSSAVFPLSFNWNGSPWHITQLKPLRNHLLKYAAQCYFLPSNKQYWTDVTGTHSTFGDRVFAAASRWLWNSLPPHLRDVDLSYSRFRWSLKTF